MFSKRVVASCFMTAFLAACAKNNLAPSSHLIDPQGEEISNGTPVSDSDPISRATVAIYLNFKGEDGSTNFKNICTGTLVDPTHVITAGHCYAEVAAKFGTTVDNVRGATAVAFGTSIVNSMQSTNVVFRKIAAATVHPKYVLNGVSHATTVAMYDVAVLKLETPAPQGTLPAQLGTGNLITAGLKLTLAGFGLTDGVKQTEATGLNKVDVIVDFPAITATQFGFRAVDGKNSCSGDSGGPAYLISSSGQLIVVGITSWGDRTCEKVGVYTSVPVMADWINSTIQAQ